MASLGEQLLAHRLRRAFTQTELAVVTGLAPEQISRFEKGHLTPTIRNLARLAEGLRLTRREVFELVMAER